MAHEARLSEAVALRPFEQHDAHSSFALLLRARRWRQEACNELCARYLPRLRRWAHGRLPGWARQHLDTEDIVQDTLMQSVRQLPDFTPQHERAFCAYVSQALRNRLRDAVRRARRDRLVNLSRQMSPRRSLSARAGARRQMLSRYDAALQRLREPDRELVVATRRAGARLRRDRGPSGQAVGSCRTRCGQPRARAPRLGDGR